jgi:hypothetical protein
VVLQRYDARADGRDSDASTSWHREILVQHSQAWDKVPEVGAAIVAVMPDFVPEDPLCESVMFHDAPLEMQN